MKNTTMTVSKSETLIHPTKCFDMYAKGSNSMLNSGIGSPSFMQLATADRQSITSTTNFQISKTSMKEGSKDGGARTVPSSTFKQTVVGSDQETNGVMFSEATKKRLESSLKSNCLKHSEHLILSKLMKTLGPKCATSTNSEDSQCFSILRLYMSLQGFR